MLPDCCYSVGCTKVDELAMVPLCQFLPQVCQGVHIIGSGDECAYICRRLLCQRLSHLPLYLVRVLQHKIEGFVDGEDGCGHRRCGMEEVVC